MIFSLFIPFALSRGLLCKKVKERRKICDGLAATATNIRCYRNTSSRKNFRPVFCPHFILSDIRLTVPFFNEFALRGDQAY